MPPGDERERIRVLTRMIEFDYVTWTIDAALIKIGQSAMTPYHYLAEDVQLRLIEDCINTVSEQKNIQSEIRYIYSDPNEPSPVQASAALRTKLIALEEKNLGIAPICESILQQQLSSVLTELDLSLGGQPVPPPLYHSTPLPMALIVSPRHIIRLDADISLLPELSLDEIVRLEDNVEGDMNMSALVVPVGGVGIYPTMVMSTANLPWLVEVISHEWIHNFLTLRPLGVLYFETPELRSMNETAANIAGKEIGRAVLERYYPEYLPLSLNADEAVQPAPPSEPLAFDFRAEMHETRIIADHLLEEGRIDEAEEYMEERRQFLWDNGYQIRKLNQAYFAFYGAYADVPGGPAGEDPVGPAVVALRTQSVTLAEFLKRISWMTSFEDLQKAIQD
jgi:hypothetical protein